MQYYKVELYTDSTVNKYILPSGHIKASLTENELIQVMKNLSGLCDEKIILIIRKIEIK